jgi:hypothetical protein
VVNLLNMTPNAALPNTSGNPFAIDLCVDCGTKHSEMPILSELDLMYTIHSDGACSRDGDC